MIAIIDITSSDNCLGEVFLNSPFFNLKDVIWILREMLQITELFDLKYRVFMRNEVTKEAEKILKLLNIKQPTRGVEMTEQSKNL